MAARNGSTVQLIDVLQSVIARVREGRRVALCAIVATRGSTPLPAGTLVSVDDAAHMTGSLGGGCVEADFRRRAHQQICRGGSELVRVQLDHDFGYDDGMICGGTMDVAIQVFLRPEDAAALREVVARLKERKAAELPIGVATQQGVCEYRVLLEAQPRLFIAGGGHLGLELARLMALLEFSVTVVDDREAYANPQRFPPPIEPVVGDIAEALRRASLGSDSFVAIVTRGHKHDEAALRAVIGSSARYIGMIGSRRKIKVILDDLRAEGVAESLLEHVHAPIGLDIGAVSAEEIAVSIAAELVAVRRGNRQSGVVGPNCPAEARP